MLCGLLGGRDGQKYADRSNLLLAITHSSHRSFTNDPQRHMMMCKPRDQRNHSINGTKGIINMAETVRISHFIRFRHSLLSGPLHNLSMILCIYNMHMSRSEYYFEFSECTLCISFFYN